MRRSDRLRLPSWTRLVSGLVSRSGVGYSWVQLGTVGYNMVQPCVLSFRPIRIAVPAHLWRRSNLTIRIDRQKNEQENAEYALYVYYIWFIYA